MAELISKVEAYIGRKVDYQSGEVNIQIDSDGTRIVEWNIDSHKKPTQSQLDALESKANELEVGYRLDAVRYVRNQKLTESDWTQSRDVTLSNDADWKTYRQALRDITKTYKSLADVKWPTAPSE